MGLSAPVRAAVEEAVEVVELLVARLLAQDFAESNVEAPDGKFRRLSVKLFRRHHEQTGKTVAVALVIAGIVRFAPDLVRYMKIRAM